MLSHGREAAGQEERLGAMTQSRTMRAMAEALEKKAKAGKAAADHFVNATTQFQEEERAHGASLTQVLGVQISSRVDGEGAFYGFWQDGDDNLAVYVYPPKHLWNGDIIPASPELHETDWQVVVGGRHVALAATINDLPALSTQKLR